MDWRWWKLARDKGVKCSINPDAHQTGDFQFLHFGVLQARKGWLRRDDVVNCLPLGSMRESLAAKRAAQS
jgi:DNA polymerase (family 10)